MYVGPATINIAGPVGSTVTGTIGTDSAGIIYTESGFASPTVIVGPAIQGGSTFVGAVGGWQLSTAGSTSAGTYDLVARQNIATAFGGLTGATYSLIQDVVRTITAGPGITATTTGSGTTAYTVGLEVTGTAGTTTYPSSITTNAYGQITSITGGLTPAFTTPVSNMASLIPGVTITGTTSSLASTTLFISLTGSYINVMTNVDYKLTTGANETTSVFTTVAGNGTTFASNTVSHLDRTNGSNSFVTSISSMDRVGPLAAGYTYTITVMASSTPTGVTLNHGHLMAFGNMM
jgi:hypothetical protein